MADKKLLIETKKLASAISRLNKLQIGEAFDPSRPESRPTDQQQQILDDIGSLSHRYVTGGNQSGKSQLGAREVAWVLTETHPNWTRPLDWGSETLLLIVMGRTTKQIEETLWRKISAFLDPAKVKISRTGGVIQKVTYENGNTILFLSHHAEAEAREKVQSFVAHYVWLDEMPGSYKLIEELHRRIQARRGYFLATFTPKVINTEIRKLVDSANPPVAQRYRLRAFDNPVYNEDDKQRILASLVAASESYRKTVLEGDWMLGEEMVYQFDYDTMVRAPTDYKYGWRHVEVVDPALKSKLGLTVWAEDPESHKWYCVLADYVTGIYVPTDIVDAVQKKVKLYNVTRRISDPHEVWYIQTAASKNITYDGVYSKANRKGELIKGLQEKLGSRLYLAPWCTDLIAELEDCRWSETTDNRIVNASTYHLLDTAQYFADAIPRPDDSLRAIPFHDWLYRENDKRKMDIAKKQEQAKQVIERRNKIWSRY